MLLPLRHTLGALALALFVCNVQAREVRVAVVTDGPAARAVFSAAAIDSLQQRLAGRLPQVRLSRRMADDFSGLEPGSFDLVVLNSVIQYFPDVDYLRRVLQGAVRAAESMERA